MRILSPGIGKTCCKKTLLLLKNSALNTFSLKAIAFDDISYVVNVSPVRKNKYCFPLQSYAQKLQRESTPLNPSILVHLFILGSQKDTYLGVATNALPLIGAMKGVNLYLPAYRFNFRSTGLGFVYRFLLFYRK